MTDTQLLTVAITLFAIFIAMLVNNHRMTDLRTDVGLRITDLGTRFEQRFIDVDKRFEQVNQRFEQVDKRFEQVDKRFEQVERRFDQRFLDMNRQMADMATMLRAEMRADHAETNAKLDSILTLMANMDQRVTKLEDRAR
jgi:hypothetical protein